MIAFLSLLLHVVVVSPFKTIGAAGHTAIYLRPTKAR